MKIERIEITYSHKGKDQVVVLSSTSSPKYYTIDEGEHKTGRHPARLLQQTDEVHQVLISELFRIKEKLPEDISHFLKTSI